VFLKALTIKGFKSFADTARLELEPGITVVVGPNGSGKSNVVDAMAWVLGAQAPTSVRSQKMDDVIFAGTSGRQALGRAEVGLTIDNSDGLLPIEFNDVTITRTLFRNGDSDYKINDVSCRLLDIQELLSDSGVGRQQHIIVSQGRIDDVLNARPEERRSIIEEAAGVLKYRKRKERAERRLAATEENLHRLKDLLREVRRQLRPLEKQADAARKYEVYADELKALKVWLAGRELKALVGKLEQAKGVRQTSRTRDDEIVSALAVLDAAILDAEAKLAALGASDVAELVGRCRSLQERIRGQHNVVGERKRRLQGELAATMDDGSIQALEAQAARIRDDLVTTDSDEKALAPRFEELERSEHLLKNEQLTFDSEWGDGLAPKPTRAPEMRAELSGLEQVAKRTAAELDRLRQDRAAMTSRLSRLGEEQGKAHDEVETLEAQLPELKKALQAAEEAKDAASKAVSELLDARRQADAEAGSWRARAEALSQALDDARSRAGANALGGADGVLGTLLDLVDIDDGWELAVEAAIGEALNAVVVDSPTNAAEALAALEAKDLAGAVLALGAGSGSVESADDSIAAMISGDANHEAVALRPRVRALNPEVEPLLDTLLSVAYGVDGTWRDAMDASQRHARAVVVTRQGDRFGPSGWRVGLSGTGATGAALDEARSKASWAKDEAAAIAEQLSNAQAAMGKANQQARSAEDAARDATNRLQTAKGTMERAKNQLGQFENDSGRLIQQIEEVEARSAADNVQLEELRAALPAAEIEEAEYQRRVEALSRSRSSLAERTRATDKARKDLEIEQARLAQQRQSLLSRQNDVVARLGELAEERERMRERRVRIEATIETVNGLEAKLDGGSHQVSHWLGVLEAEQQVQSKSAQAVSNELSQQRQQRVALERELEQVRKRHEQANLEETEARVKLEAITGAVRRELDTEPRAAMDAAQPEIPGGASAESRVRELEQQLSKLGPINPLALEEFTALKERHEFVESQLDDVKTTRKDLSRVIRTIDSEIVEVFAAAYADVSENFVKLFATLFPGGTGGVRLTNGEDLLNCGIEIEAKPSGKNVKKLSLLSGGERSLVALAFLFAVFRSRPSPFYVMDEVEAALDDVNLSRFLGLLEEFRKEAQLIVVSHQKRTMEAGDVLYGVSMKPGGSSKVVSEKVDESRALQGG